MRRSGSTNEQGLFKHKQEGINLFRSSLNSVESGYGVSLRLGRSKAKVEVVMRIIVLLLLCFLKDSVKSMKQCEHELCAHHQLNATPSYKRDSSVHRAGTKRSTLDCFKTRFQATVREHPTQPRRCAHLQKFKSMAGPCPAERKRERPVCLNGFLFRIPCAAQTFEAAPRL